MTTEIDQTWAFTCVEEGGADLSLDPNDNGNWTMINGERTLLGSKWGCSADDLVRMMHPVLPVKRDMANLTQAAAEANFQVHYVNVLRANEMPPGFACLTADFGYNAGAPESGRVLQTALGMTADAVDGWVGAKTLAALANAVGSNTPPDAVLETCSLAAVKAVQTALGITGKAVDGLPGPKTHDALSSAKTPMAIALLALVASDQVAAYRTFRQFSLYGNDWTERSWRRLALSLKIALEA